jgi:Holliday junction DNA helicase RuvA
MIGMLTGTLALRDGQHIILDVHGVGYNVLASSQILTSSHQGDTITVFIHTHIREDAFDLFGFSTQQDLKVFQYLISVNGIGPKTAMGIFAVGSREEILKAIQKADVDFFTGVPRLGRKNAQKIIIELKNKLGSGQDLDLSEESDELSQVISALISMGFSEREARAAAKMIGEQGSSTSEKVRLALKQLGK